MIRRDFLIKSGILSSGVILAGGGLLKSCTGSSKYGELSRHTVDRVEYGSADFRWPRHAGRNARIGVHGQYKTSNYIQLFTDQGASGWGLMTYGEMNKDAIKKSVLGKTVNELINPDTGILETTDQALDLSLHDLAGVILGIPVYQMLGANGPKETQVYSGMIYMDEMEPEDNPAGVERVLENCRWDYDYGYRKLKVKIGRSGRWYPHDEGLAMDIRIIKMIHEEFGDKIDILVDVNDMYSLQDTIDFFKGIEGIPLYWMEEPFPENLEEGRKLKEWMIANGWENTYYADGERNPDLEVCLQLAREKKMDVYLADIVGFGFTPWRKLMPKLIELNMTTCPHAWGTMIKTQAASHLAAGLGNVCTLEGVTCFSEDIDFGPTVIVDGKLRVSEEPGFGIKLLKR